MSQIFAVINTAVDTGATTFTNLDDRTDTLRSCWSGATAPSAPVDGQLWFDTANLILYYYDGSGWVEVGTVISSAVDFNLNQLTNGRLENRASDPTSAAGNVGYVLLHTGAGKIKVVASATVLETVVSLSNADLWSLHLPLRAWKKDATNPPDDVVIGTTPEWHTWRFDDALQRMHTSVMLPRGFSEDADAILRVHYLLNAAETANDVLAARLDYVALDLDSVKLADRTSTQQDASAQSIGANAAQYTFHKCDILLPYNDASNPLAANCALGLSWGLSAVSSVAEAAVIGAELLSPCGSTGITEVV